MKRLSLLALLCVWCYIVVAQVTTIPAILQQGYKGEITVIFNPNEGSKGMLGATTCYAHTGYNNWQGASQWRAGEEKYKMTKNTDGNWELKITPDMYSYYGATSSTKITRLCFVFNDGPLNGRTEDNAKTGRAADGTDIFVPVVESGLAISFSADKEGIVSQGDEVTFTCSATEEATLTLKQGSTELKTETGKSMTYTMTLTQIGTNTFEFIASQGEVTKSAKIQFYVATTPVEEERPYENLGIYYDENDNTKCTLVMYAANKAGEPAKHVFLIGDLTNWMMSNNYQLKQDGPYFWITLDNLTPGKEYAFQYSVVRSDGVVKRICDLYSEKVLSKDDKYEPKQHDPTLRDYPSGADGSFVTVIQTDKPKFEWSEATLNFKRPNKNNLIIYELWVYDFTHNRGFDGVINRLDYLEQLGVNAIEFMPLSEFDGNYNWGYSPCLYLALDKAYGSQTNFKDLVDECHKRGIAVIVDMVFNHATGNNPMNKLYPFGADLAQNPWFNVKPPHGDNFYEDWNHDFKPAHQMFIDAMKYWIEEYKVDGYRLDLSHGLCGPTDNAVYNLKDYYAKAIEPYGAYLILEHWGKHTSSDWPKLIEAGMQCWINTNPAYMEAAMGYYSKANFTDANADGKVSYCESHDEERMQYKAMKYGSGNVKNEEVRIQRIPACVAMNVLLDGSHMLWMFEEVGYDHSINSDIDHPDGYNDSYRCNKKPRYEPYLHNEARMEQYVKVAQAIQLRTKIMPTVFEGNPTNSSLSTTVVKSVQWGSDVFVVANFHPSDEKSVSLPSGTWYDYYANGAKAGSSVTLKAGEVKIYTGKQVELPNIDPSKVNIEEVLQDAANAASYKFYRDGNIYIHRDGKIYDMMGRRVQ